MMLNDAILIFTIGFLIAAVVFNLWLTLGLIRAFRQLPIPNSSEQRKLADGSLIKDFSFDRITDKQSETLYKYQKYAKVFVFLISKCPKCKTKLPELHESIERANGLGVVIRLLTKESKGRMKHFLDDDVLLNVTMRISKSNYNYLNPEGISPYYLFIDSENILQAQGLIGDENWSNFIEQLKQG